MNTLNALDVVASIAPNTHKLLMQNSSEGLTHGAFALVCASESFEQVVSSKFKMLATELANCANTVFASLGDHLNHGFDEFVSPEAKYKAFDRFEKVFLCLDLVVEDFDEDDWRAQLAWRNVQEYASAVKVALIRTAA